ncbi:MAG: glycosyltransferase family 2 protein [Chloroflexi bacterium]|nr:glycosyltransferase family 2 protein [Chloroflexota bacterium]
MTTPRPDPVCADSLLVIIPALNEQGAIRQVVKGVHVVLPTADILVIDDGSSDDTAQEAQAAGALVVRHPFNLGIGGAVQTGLKFACHHHYEYVIRMDGDGQHDACSIQAMLAVLQAHQADMVIGSRFLDADVDWHIPLSRRLGIRLYALEVTWLTGSRFTDTTSGFWAMNRRTIQVLAAYLPQDYPDVESRIIVHKAGLKQMELPVHMGERTTGVSSINLARSIYYAFKVTVAVITTALKDYPLAVLENHNADTVRAKGRRHPLQSHSLAGDLPTDP